MRPLDVERAAVLCAGIGLVALAAFLASHYFPYFSGDAVIHLEIMDRSAHGGWFEFNAGTPEAASSSVLWTLLGAALLRAAGSLALALVVLKVACLVGWLTLGGLSYALARRLGADRTHAFAAAALSIALPGTTMNSLQGMENAWFAVAVVAALLLHEGDASERLAAPVYCLAGLACALRPEGIVLLLVVLSVRVSALRREWPVAVVALTATCFAPLGWYAYKTGHVVPTSAISRTMDARRRSLSVGLGPFWIYGAPLVRLAAYAPLAVGAWFARSQSTAIAAVILGGLALYTFGTGCSQTSRYMIWLFALLCALAASTMQRAHLWGLTGLLWILAVMAGEACLRLERGSGYTVQALLDAVSARTTATDALLSEMGTGGCHRAHPAIATHEVQERFWLDDRVRVLSLDGVTRSAWGREPTYQPNGCPALDAVLKDPDVLGILTNPGEYDMRSCVTEGPVRQVVDAWGHADTPGWHWTGTMMVRMCALDSTSP
jgi:hypothetical protein